MSKFPAFYDPQRIGTLFYPDLQAIEAEAVAAALSPAALDEEKVQLLLIDMQIDFCHEAGSLYVPGALGDIQRLVEFIYRHASSITGITCTLDSHLPFQIFHSPWWADREGNHPDPLTIITHDDIKAGKWRPLVAPEHSVNYVKQLEEGAKKQLTIWPYHVMMGGMGNMLDPELWSAVIWHALARKTQPNWVIKGTVPESEYYSAVQPEIPVPDHPQGGKNQPFLDFVAQSDYLVVAGEAESHCVLETLEDIVAAYSDRPEILQKIYVLRDCTSPVQHPDVDFHALALEQFEAFAQKGVHFVDSTADLPFLETPEAPQETAELVPVAGLQRMGQWRAKNS